jgi:hypothetical protein
MGHRVTVFHRTRAELPAGVGRIVGDRQRLAAYAGALRRIGPRQEALRRTID